MENGRRASVAEVVEDADGSTSAAAMFDAALDGGSTQ